MAKIIASNENCIIKHLSFIKSEIKDGIFFIEQEALIMRNLDHPNIPRLLNFFTIENDNNIDVYLVQEYIKSENLKEIVKKGRRFNEAEVIEIALKICKILTYIHSFSPPIIHQDIKPANILLSYDKDIFLIDFGSVKQNIVYENENAGLSTIIGTQGYMPIEQFEGRTVQGSDIYALGLTLIYLLSGKEPLEIDKTGLEFNLENVINVSDQLIIILEKMILPDFRNRYQSALELQEDLLNLKDKKELITKKRQHIYHTVKSEIHDLERLRWYSKPYLKGTLFFEDQLLIIYSGLFLVYTVIILTLKHIYKFNMGIDLFFVTFVALSLLVSEFLFIYYLGQFSDDSSKIKTRNHLLKKIYVFTDKRLLIISELNPRKVESYNLNTFKYVKLNAYNPKRDKGDLFFRSKKFGNDVTLEMVGNVSFVYGLADELINKSNV